MSCYVVPFRWLRLPDDAHKLFDWIRVGRGLPLAAIFRQPVRIFGSAPYRLGDQAYALEELVALS